LKINHNPVKALILILIASTFSFCQESIHLTAGTIAGGVTETSARIRISVSGNTELTLLYSTSEDFSGDVSSESAEVNSGEDHSVIIQLNELSPDTKYYYRVLINGETADEKVRSFRTFPPLNSLNNFNFIFGSCQQSVSSAKGEIFREIVKYNPAFFLQIGDWTYPDTTDNLPFNRDYFSLDYNRVLRTYRAKFRSDYGMDTLLRSIPVSYVYDDHDYVNNNASALSVSYGVPFKSPLTGNEFILEEIEIPPAARLNSIKGFINNMPDYPVENPSRGIYRKFRYANAEIYMLDLRSQRSPNFNSLQKNASGGKWEFVKPAGHTMLGNSSSPGEGEDQFTWLKRNLKETNAKWKFLICSVPLNRGQFKGITLGLELQDSLVEIPNTGISVNGIVVPMELSDKWVAFAEELELLLNFIRINNISNVFVLSGDSHTSAMDDGTNAGLPEIMSGNLDIGNSGTAALFASLGVNIWNKGGQGISTSELNNAFGYVEISGNDSVQFKIISENGSLISSMTMYDQDILDAAVVGLQAKIESDKVLITWNISGLSGVKDFEIQKSEEGLIFRTIGKTARGGTEYTYSDFYERGYNYYRIRVNSVNGSYKFSDAVMTGDEVVPTFFLMQNYPNPFNISTRIRFGLREDSQVSVTLYNLLGERTRILLNEFRKAGEHEISFIAQGLPSGIYFYRINSEGYSEIKKMVLLR
jgi:alkaline phosphatase D